MAFVKINHDEARQGPYMPPEGFYEVIIASMQYAATNSGTEYLRVKLDIRADIAQEGAGESIDWPIWRKKEPTPRDPDGFPNGTIQAISRCAGLESGVEYANMDAWINALLQRPIRVEIRHNEWQGRVRAQVSYLHETEHPVVNPTPKGFIAVSDEEVPF